MSNDLKKIEDILARLPDARRKELTNALDLTPERQELPSAALTAALGGGLGYGRTVTVFGSKSSGKSSLLLQMIAMAQSKGKVCAWMDAERSFDSTWAEKLGVDCENLIVSDAVGMNLVGDQIVDLIQAGTDIVVVDSVSALVPASYMDKKGAGLSGMDNTKKIGSFSMNLKALIKSVNFVNKNSLVIFISQHTTEINQNYTKQSKDGGNAINYYSSQVIHLVSGNSNSWMLEGDVTLGDKIFRRQTGRKVNWEVEFNKLGEQGATGSYDFYFSGDRIGVDRAGEFLDLAIELGLVHQAKSWLSFDSPSRGQFKLQGRVNFIEELWNDSELAKELEDSVRRYL